MNAELQIGKPRLTDPARWTRAQVMPFVVFMAFMLFLQFGGELFSWDHPSAPWWRRWPEQWIYPLQTICCLGVLWQRRTCYEFEWKLTSLLWGVVFGAVGIGLWLLPTTLYDHWHFTQDPDGWLKWLGVAARKKGFDPQVLEEAWAVQCSLVFRFIRAAVVVALVEEIFWRSFLMRYCMNPDGNYWTEPFGRASFRSYAIVTAAFVLAHAPIDYAAALIYGSLTYLLCIWTKNLLACVSMHATANFLMGCYIMKYGKYGLW